MGVVPVHEAHQVPRLGHLEEVPDGGLYHTPQVLVDCVGNDPDPRLLLRQLAGNGQRVIGASVIHRDHCQLVACPGQRLRLGQPLLGQPPEVSRLVVAGQIDKQGWHPTTPFSYSPAFGKHISAQNTSGRRAPQWIPLTHQKRPTLGQEGGDQVFGPQDQPVGTHQPHQEGGKKMAKEAASYRVSNTCRAEST